MKKGSGSAVSRLLSPSSLSHGAQQLESLRLFLSRAQRRRAALSADAFPPFLAACRSFPSLASQTHALALKYAADLHPATATALLDLYGRRGLLRDALRVFDEMPLRDPIAWNALLSCFLRQGLAADALSTFRRMTEDGVAFTGATLSAALKACASLRAVRLGKQIHARAIREGDDSLITSTSLIDFYSACGLIQNAFDVFAGVDCDKDAAIHNSLISACVKNRRFEEAFSILGSATPNAVALTCAFSVCSRSSNPHYGKQAHCAAIRHGFDSDTTLCNAIVDMYAKCGELSSARLAFERIHRKNVVSWTSIIEAYGSHGHGVEAWNLFKKMEEEESSNGLSPNAVTFLSVLSACGHSGLVDEGRESFFAMRNKYGIDPGPEHCSSFIDLLGRAGRIEEAWHLYGELSRRSSKKLTSAVCVAMLNACRANMDLARGEQVAEHLLELGDSNPASYILLSNFYAAAGKWERAESLRRAMRNRQLKKEVGNSQFV
ncbi:pentatricopeptide repeat-containing protein At5g66500, mitochondrial-like isoform X2 [Zingiber officinale]|uniref:Pentatricopeptide repeat-containing protein n=1 Tax=Zingiber officinale TaxID=94328 RepID=A0A8J5LHC3_ZINOF|nr:pentatricopeptide repeat-containing protein At5g66500, mitochondrial-like isoform X2 [Zingiber officinale]KAG6515267.1 hypothetical protein ZIOFF_025659 [Zingiber officinale]